MCRLVAPRVKEGTGLVALATSEIKRLVVEEPVNLSKGTVVSLVNDEPESLKESPRFPKTCLSDETVGLSREYRIASSRAYTSPGNL